MTKKLSENITKIPNKLPNLFFPGVSAGSWEYGKKIKNQDVFLNYLKVVFFFIKLTVTRWEK